MQKLRQARVRIGDHGVPVGGQYTKSMDLDAMNRLPRTPRSNA